MLYEDKDNREGALLDMLYYSTPVCLDSVLKLGIRAVLQQKRFSYAEGIFRRVNWENKAPLPFEWVGFLQQYLAESGDEALFYKYGKRILQLPELKEIFFPSLQTMISRYPEKERLFAEAVRGLRMTSGKEDKMSETKKPLLSISLLISNGRTDTIKKCMESLLPLRAAVPSELIIVDTGCTDGGAEIAREYADQMVSFPWCNDFAAARNAGLERCSGEWFMFIDDDEWFEDVTEIIWFFQSGEYKKYTKGIYVARNYENMEGTSYEETMAGRMYRLFPGIRFEGKLHEYLPVREGATYAFRCFVHHYGYAYRTEEEHQKHAERNFKILKQMMEEEPENFRTAAHLLQEYMASARFAEAIEFCEKMLALCRKRKNTEFYDYFLLVLPEAYGRGGRFEDAQKEYRRIMEEEPLSKYALTKLWAVKCILERHWGTDQGVLESMQMYIKLYEDKENRGEPILDLLYYSTPICFRTILEFGWEAMCSLKEFRYAELIFSRVDWKETMPIPYKWVSFLQDYLAETGDLELFCKCSGEVLQVPELREMFLPNLQTMIGRYPDKEAIFTEAVRRLRQPKVNPELVALGEQMKGIIEGQLASGNTAEAKNLLLEVESMLPNEAWVQELKKRLL